MKYVLFDLDGTITNPKEGITKSAAYALSKFGIQVEDLDTLCPFIGPPLSYSFKTFYGFHEEDTLKAIDYYREFYSVDGVFDCTIYDGIKELLAHLKEKGTTVLLATSKPENFAVDLLKHFDIYEYFDIVAGSNPDSKREEKADVIAHAISQLDGFDAKDAVMIGDTRFDAIGASQFGIPCILVDYGYGIREELEACQPMYLADTVADLQKFLDTI